MIVQASDFVGKIKIANTAQSDVNADLTANFINILEPEFLTKLLGSALYAEFTTGLATQPVEAKWTTLKTTIGTSIANYIYWFYTGDNSIQTVAMGQVKGQSANATQVLPDQKMCNVWNDMVELCYKVVNLINNNPNDYGDYYIENFYYKQWLNDYCDRPEIFYKVNVFSI